MAFAYGQTYGLPVIVTRASNNFGPYQYPEKLIPLFVTNAIDDLPLPLYGDDRDVRDCLHVDDTAPPSTSSSRGSNGETYNIGGGNERENREIADKILVSDSASLNLRPSRIPRSACGEIRARHL